MHDETILNPQLPPQAEGTVLNPQLPPQAEGTILNAQLPPQTEGTVLNPQLLPQNSPDATVLNPVLNRAGVSAADAAEATILNPVLPIEAALKTLTYGSTREILRQVDEQLG